ncbi:MAG: hypothetical protein AAF441_15200 [Pseudomonadota bacterium]
MLDKITCAEFEKHLNQEFKVDSDEVDMSLKLVEAKAMAHGKREGGAFTLLFSGPEDPQLQQGMIPLEHPEMGKIELFMVCVGPGQGELDYEVIFT